MSHEAARWSARRSARTLLSVALLALACAQGAAARSSDRDQVMTIDAGHTTGTLDDSTPTVLAGGVTINQGTLHIEAAKAVLTGRGGDIARVVLTGSPASLEQLLDDGTPMSAIANEIDYDMRTEVVVLIGDVFIKQPRNSLRGDRVVYNMRTGQVTSGGEGSGRVRMRILPKNGGDAQSGSTQSDTPQPAPATENPPADESDDRIDDPAAEGR